MVQTKTLAVDGDGHVLENAAELVALMDEPYREFRGSDAITATLVPVDGQDRNLGQRLLRGSARTAQEWLDALERGPMEWTAVYPTMGLFSGFIKDPDYQAVFCKAYNAWLAGGIVAESGGKVLGVGLLPTHDADEAAVELRRAKALGMVAVMFPADGTHLLGHRRFDGVYEAAAELDMPVAVHASGSTMAPGAEVFPKFIQAHSVAHPFGILRHFTSMMFEGVFERFPTVRFGFLETGATWVPWWLDRLDEEFSHRGEVDAPLLPNRPSTYVREGGNIFFGAESEERLLGPTLDIIGSDTVMYASDYPHWDGDYPNSLHEMQARTDLTEAQRQGVLRGAAERFYGVAGR